MISQETIALAADLLQRAAPPGSQVVLFGSYARGTANEHSDVDLMVIQPQVNHWLYETDRLYRVLRPLRLPVDLLVTTRELFNRQKESTSTVYHEAHSHGKVLNPRA